MRGCGEPGDRGVLVEIPESTWFPVAGGRIFAFLFASGILLGVIAGPAAAQLTGSISGVARDAAGAPLSGVGVTITSPVLQGRRMAVTGSDGTYRVLNLAAGGDYQVVFALLGFRTFEATKQEVRLGLDLQVNATMQVSSVAAEVAVTSETLMVDVTQTNTQQNYDRDYLKNVPIGSFSSTPYQRVVGQAPGVVLSAPGNPNPNVLGSRPLDNGWQVDGVNTSDPTYHTWTMPMNLDAVQEMSIQTSSYAAEYGRASGGIINVVTKAGGNDFKGTFDIRYDDNRFTENGVHFDNSQSKARNTPWGATLGGPVAKDVLWFFLNTNRSDYYRTPFTDNPVILSQNPTPPVRAFTGWSYGGKLSFTVIPELEGFFSFQNAPSEVTGATDNAAIRPEATYTNNQGPYRLFSLKLSGVLNQNWLADLNLGIWRLPPGAGSTPASGYVTSAWKNTQGNVWYDNFRQGSSSSSGRDLGGVSTTYLVGDVLGSHQLKTGFDTDRTSLQSSTTWTGTPSNASFCPGPAGRTCGAYFFFNGFDAAGNRIPYRQFVNESDDSGPTGRSYAAYLQDQWSPIRNLALNLGLRWDKTKFYGSSGPNLFSFVKLQPRLAAAWDVVGDGRNRLSASWGYYYTDPGLTVAALSDFGYSYPVQRIYQWSAAAGTWKFLNQTGGGYASQPLIDSPLYPTYVEQVNVAFERKIVRGLSGAVTYVYKKTHDIFDDTCSSQPDCPKKILSNRPGASFGVTDALQANYFAWMFALDYRSARVHAYSSYVYSKNQGSVDQVTQYQGDDFNWYPDNFVNRYGYLGDDARNRFKLYGAWRIPWIETTLSFAYNYQSGLPYTVTQASPFDGNIYVEPRGTDRMAVLNNLDLQFMKAISVQSRLSITPIFTIFNVFSQEQPTAYGTTVGSLILRQPIAWNRPRTYQIGVRIDWF